ncbi:MAG TPA: Do family serine endopeptidase [Polyangiaceae bacterium]|nr:Do family serine endopeptidase [Polyangiaceae bacterium]
MGDRDALASASKGAIGTSPSAAPVSAAPLAPGAVVGGAPDVATLVARVRPAVVNITVTAEAKVSEAPFQLPFDFFFGQQNPRGTPRGDRSFQRRGLGSGFIIDDAGHVITNAHVVADAKTVKVRLLDEREFTATVRGRDSQLDVAVLDLVGAGKLPAVELGSSEATRIGEYVVAIGNPFGLGDTVTMGIVSAKSRAIGAGPYDDFIQTDAAINPGNSGGPLLNISGQVVGINTAINPAGQGIGFAIPIDDVKQILPQLLTTGRVSRGRLGVAIQMMDEATAKALGLDRPRGALVAEVVPDGPGAKVGLRASDVILSVDEREIRDSHELPRVVATHEPGSKVNVKIWRDRAEHALTVTLDELKDESPAERSPSPHEGSGTATPSLGVSIADSQAGPTIARVQPGSAAEGQLQPGDVILEVNREPVRNVADVTRRLDQSPRDRPVLLKVRRGDHDQFVAITRP